jgi:hypothetical protein
MHPRPVTIHLSVRLRRESHYTVASPLPGGRYPLMCSPSTFANIPSNSEIREVVRELWSGWAAGATGLQAEHIKVWLQDVVQEEKEQSIVGHGNKWRILQS